MDLKCWDRDFQVQENTFEVGLILEKSTLMKEIIFHCHWNIPWMLILQKYVTEAF
jgi:hypothetical protein